jgi:hypothetical protein
MQKPVLHYDREHDILYLVIREGEEDHFVEVVEEVSVSASAVLFKSANTTG